MLSRLFLKAGTKAGQTPLEVPLSPVTIFVGPNNSGKSRALAEIEEWVTAPQGPSGLLVKKLEFDNIRPDVIEAELSKIEVAPSASERLNVDHILVGRLKPQNNSAVRMQVHKAAIINEASDPNARPRHHYCQFLSLFTVRLDGKNRLALTDAQPVGDLQNTPPNHIAHLFSDNASRGELSRIVKEAFGKYLVIDPTNPGQLRFRLSARAPRNEQEERGWDSVAVEFHKNATLISEASDGVKAFVGMLTTVVAGEPWITLIDEPEAFLSPALCTRLGKELTSALKGKDRRLFIATHSASFLMGCVQSGEAINIVRLTYDYSTATARLLTKDKLTPLMRNPLLRSVGVLNALFYSAVIVTEADADRAFYQEINERLLATRDSRGIEGCLFLNARNKQTVWDIVRPLRELGIPAAGVVDLDVVNEGGAVWQKPLAGAFIPPLMHGALSSERSAILAAFEREEAKTGGKFKRQGVEMLSGTEQEACYNFLAQLAEYGVFVVARGEIEAWLSDLAVSRDKGTWLTTIFEAMGEDPSDPKYVNPAKGDVWDFIGSIRNWVSNPSHKGIPV